MQVAISTLGCPQWGLDDIIARFAGCGADAIDFRGTAEGLDITVLPAFTTGLAATARRIADAGLAVSGISSSLRVCDPGAEAANLEEAKRTIPVALGLGAKFVRVFGGGPEPKDAAERAARARRGAAHLDAVLRLPGAERLGWLVETHDQWIAHADVLAVLDLVAAPNAGVLWDIAHTIRHADETAADTVAAYGARIRNTHVKDAARGGGVWRYAQPGEGELGLGAALDALAAGGYGGPVTLEHEKRWQPELAEPEEVFPRFVQWARRWGASR